MFYVKSTYIQSKNKHVSWTGILLSNLLIQFGVGNKTLVDKTHMCMLIILALDGITYSSNR